MLTHYHNQAAARGQPVEVLNKLPGTMKFNFPEKKAHPKWTFTNVDTSDIRFTHPKSGGAVYAVSLAWPEADHSLIIKSINGQTLPGRITGVTLLGHQGDLKFGRGADGLRVELPDPPATAVGGRPCALKISIQ